MVRWKDKSIFELKFCHFCVKTFRLNAEMPEDAEVRGELKKLFNSFMAH